jgi:hypothetical protein
MTTSRPTKLTARGPADLIALVPVVLGFHPQDSVVLLTFGPTGTSFHARVDLPVDVADQEEVAGLLLAAVLRNGVRRAALVLYTDDEGAAGSQAELVLGRLLEHGVEVVDVLRADDGRWFPVPDDGSGGTPYDLGSHRFTAQHVYDGGVVHEDRAALADSLVGTDDDDHTAVVLAAGRYADQLRDAVAAGEAFLRDELRWLQRRIRRAVADPAPLPVGDVARLLVLCSQGAAREVAVCEITRADAAAHVALWLDLVRRAPHPLVPGAAAVLAFAAWQRGDGALAWCAIDRCLEVEPEHPLAECVARVLTDAVPPTVWHPPAGGAPAASSTDEEVQRARDQAS